MRGAGANILRGVASAGVLSIYDQAQILLGSAVTSQKTPPTGLSPKSAFRF